MSPATIGLLIFAVTFGGVLFGTWLRVVLPQHYFDKDSQDAIKLGIGLIATMTALVLGLITASTKSSFDDVDATVSKGASELLALDRVLARYGPDAAAIRQNLQSLTRARVDAIWQQTAAAFPSPAMTQAEAITEGIRSLTPTNDSQRALQAKAIDVAESLLLSRWTTVVNNQPSVPVPFLTILVVWQTFIFMSFGLLAPRNPLVVAVLFVCALSVGSAMFLILEMDSPFHGLIRVSNEPLRAAIAHMNQ